MTLIAAPDRTLDQRLVALERANAVRMLRAQTKDRLRARDLTFADVLAIDEDWTATWKVQDVIRAIPKYGRVKTNTVLRRHDVSPSKTLGGLTDRQRAALLEAIT